MRKKKYSSGQSTTYGILTGVIGGSIQYLIAITWLTVAGYLEYAGLFPALLSLGTTIVLFIGTRQWIFLAIEEKVVETDQSLKTQRIKSEERGDDQSGVSSQHFCDLCGEPILGTVFSDTDREGKVKKYCSGTCQLRSTIQV